MLALLILCSSLKLINADGSWNFYVNTGNRSTGIPGVLTPLILVNVSDASALTEEDKLQVRQRYEIGLRDGFYHKLQIV